MAEKAAESGAAVVKNIIHVCYNYFEIYKRQTTGIWAAHRTRGYSLEKITNDCFTGCTNSFCFVAIAIYVLEGGFTANALEYIGRAWLIMLLAVLIPNMVYAFVLKRNGYNHRNLFFWNMTLKLAHIPVYIAIFMLGVFMGMMILGIMLIPFLALFDYSLLLSSSMYGISGLCYASGRGLLPKKQVILCGICQFVFVLDLLCSIYLFSKYGKEIENQETKQ